MKFAHVVILAGLGLAAYSAYGFAKVYVPTKRDQMVIESHPNLSRVIDADTIVVGDVKVRLDGISAPERGHPAYQDGKHFVTLLMRKAENIECELEGRKTYDREVGICWFVMADGERLDPQAAVVAAGLARDCPRYSKGRYKRYEIAASRALPLPGYC